MPVNKYMMERWERQRSELVYPWRREMELDIDVGDKRERGVTSVREGFQLRKAGKHVIVE